MIREYAKRKYGKKEWLINYRNDTHVSMLDERSNRSLYITVQQFDKDWIKL